MWRTYYEQQCSSCIAVETVASAPRAILMGFIEQRKEEAQEKKLGGYKKAKNGKGWSGAKAKKTRWKQPKEIIKSENNNKEFIPIMKKNGTQ